MTESTSLHYHYYTCCVTYLRCEAWTRQLQRKLCTFAHKTAYRPTYTITEHSTRFKPENLDYFRPEPNSSPKNMTRYQPSGQQSQAHEPNFCASSHLCTPPPTTQWPVSYFWGFTFKAIENVMCFDMHQSTHQIVRVLPSQSFSLMSGTHSRRKYRQVHEHWANILRVYTLVHPSSHHNDVWTPTSTLDVNHITTAPCPSSYDCTEWQNDGNRYLKS